MLPDATNPTLEERQTVSMSDGGDTTERESDADRDAAPIDYDILDRLGHRLAGSERFEHIEYRPEYAPNSVVLEFDLGYFPAAVEQASCRVRWYENDDFSFHYTEQYRSGQQWECRWDRHPNPHNAREHFHPPPDAATPGRDASHPTDWRTVLAEVLQELDSHVKAFWE